MDVKGIRLLERIGEAGLRAVLAGSFDHGGLVRLANACRLRFPGRRTQHVKEKEILDALVHDFLEKPAARATVMKALIRANEPLASRLAAVPAGEISEAVTRLKEAEVAPALFVLADADDGPPEALVRSLKERIEAAAPPAGSSSVAPQPRDAVVEALRDRIQTLEASLEARDAAIEHLEAREREARQDALAACKESHQLRRDLSHAEEERRTLREENARLSTRASRGEVGEELAAKVEEIAVRVNQIVREDRKIGHEVEELLKAKPGGNESLGPYLQALAVSVDSLRREFAQVRKETDEESRRLSKLMQELSAELRATHSEIMQIRKTSAEPPSRPRGEPSRVGLFVDVQNMYYAARQHNARLDFGALMASATRDRRLIRATAYVVQNRDIDQSGFLAMLQQKNYEVRRKDLRVRHDGSSKGDWDMEMALDILGLAPSLDVVVLVSGDGDFVSLVTQIKTLGPRVEVYSFPGSTARELIEAADRHVPIDEGFLIRMSPSA